MLLDTFWIARTSVKVVIQVYTFSLCFAVFCLR